MSTKKDENKKEQQPSGSNPPESGINDKENAKEPKEEGENGGTNDIEEDLNAQIAAARYSTDAQKRIADFRVRIDSLYLTAKELPASRETALAVTAFQSARQFCGIILGEKGASSPYAGSTDPNNKSLSDRSDKGEVLEGMAKEFDIIAKIKFLRGAADDVITDFAVYMDNSSYGSVKEFVAQNEVLAGLIGGKMWLGERLGELYRASQQTDIK